MIKALYTRRNGDHAFLRLEDADITSPAFGKYSIDARHADGRSDNWDTPYGESLQTCEAWLRDREYVKRCG